MEKKLNPKKERNRQIKRIAKHFKQDMISMGFSIEKGLFKNPHPFYSVYVRHEGVIRVDFNKQSDIDDMVCFIPDELEMSIGRKSRLGRSVSLFSELEIWAKSHGKLYVSGLISGFGKEYTDGTKTQRCWVTGDQYVINPELYKRREKPAELKEKGK